MTTLNRKRGCLLGLAVGDALGAAVEFMPRGTFPPVTGYRTGTHNLNPGEWTDDTSMALALADSIAHAGWDLTDQLHRYLDWYKNGTYSVNGKCFDIGGTTSAALNRFDRERSWMTSGLTDERSSGNGSIMRLAPVAIAYSELVTLNLNDFAVKAMESSLTTHASGQCKTACGVLALVLAGLIEGVSKFDVLLPSWKPMQQFRAVFGLDLVIDSMLASNKFRMHDWEKSGIRSAGHVAKTLEAALAAFWSWDNFKDVVLAAVNLGGDADTTGAVAGQLAGALYGESGIPAEWLEGLARRDMIEKALTGIGAGKE